jgi:hypothetical protein
MSGINIADLDVNCKRNEHNTYEIEFAQVTEWSAAFCLCRRRWRSAGLLINLSCLNIVKSIDRCGSVTRAREVEKERRARD